MSKTCLVIASYPESILSFRGHLIDALIAKGLKVYVAAPDITKSIKLVAALKEKGAIGCDFSLAKNSVNVLDDLKSLLSLLRLMRSIRPVYVLAYTVKPVLYGLLAASLTRIPHRFALITGLGYAFQGESSLPKKLVKFLYWITLKRVECVFFQNKDDEALFRSLSLLNASTLSCVVNGSGVDLSYYPVTSLPKQMNFLLIGRLLSTKGVREYAAAAKQLKIRYPGVLFSLVGWIDGGPDSIDTEELQNWIDGGYIRYLGKVADPRPFIEESSVYVLPSYREGTPRSVLEAMSMGRPIITSDAPGCRETVQNGKNGYLVPVRCVDSLVEAMAYFIENPSAMVSMGQVSRYIAEKKYDVHAVNRCMLEKMGV